MEPIYEPVYFVGQSVEDAILRFRPYRTHREALGNAYLGDHIYSVTIVVNPGNLWDHGEVK